MRRPFGIYTAWQSVLELSPLHAAADAWEASAGRSTPEPSSTDVNEGSYSRGDGPSWQQVGLTIANCLIGAGALGMPFAMRMAGWAGLIVITFATATTCYTAKCLVWSFDTINARELSQAAKTGSLPNLVETYDGLVERCFGRAGAIGMKFMTVVELYGGVVCMVVLHVSNWPTLLGLPSMLVLPGIATLDTRIAVAAMMCTLALPTLLIQSRFLSAFAILGLGATTLLFVATCLVPMLTPPLAEGEACSGAPREGQTMGHAWLHQDGLGITTGLALFAFAGHATFPELHNRMARDERHHFDSACNLGFSVAACFYCLLGGLGYYIYGDCTLDAFTLNLMGSNPTLGGLATTGVLLSTFTSISVLCVPVVRIAHESIEAVRVGLVPPPPPSGTAQAHCKKLGTVAQSDTGGIEAQSEKVNRTVRCEKAEIDIQCETAGTEDTLALVNAQLMEAGVAIDGAFDKDCSFPLHTGSIAIDEGAAVAKGFRLPSSAVAMEGIARHPFMSLGGIFQPYDTLDVLVKALLMVAAGVLAVAVPNFGYIVALMGAFTCMLMSFILPAACNMIVHYRVYSSGVLILNGLVVCIGTVGMYVGVQSTIARGAE